MKRKLGAIVAVEWLDARAEFGESRFDDMLDTVTVTTYGILLRDDETVSVAWERFGDGSEPIEFARFRTISHIPRGMVKSIRELG